MMESAILAAMVVLAIYFAGKIPDRCISNTRKDQAYMFRIIIRMEDSGTCHFELYSDYPYSSMEELMEAAHISRKTDFIEIPFSGKTVSLNKSRIVSASMEVLKYNA